MGAVGDHGAHTDGQGEEHLTACGRDDFKDAGSLFNNAVGHGPAGDKHILQAVHSAGQGAGADDADQQHHEQRGHADTAELLDAAADAAHDDEHRQDNEDQAVDDALALIQQEASEHITAGHAVGAEAGVEQVAHVQHDVLDAVAAQCAVEAHDQERGGDAQPADPLELLAQCVVRGDSALAGLTADGQLAQHDDKAAQDCQDEVDDEECEAAGGAHLIGEAPDVAQADCGADRGHQETKIGSKAFSFFHVFSPYNFFFPLACPYRQHTAGADDPHESVSCGSCKSIPYPANSRN